MKISTKRIKEIIKEEYLKIFESSLDWEKNFKGFNKKELSAIESLVMMSAGGISDVLRDYKKNKSAFKAFIKDMVKGGMFEGQVEEGGKGSGRPTKAGSKRDMEKRMDKAVSDANAKLDAAEKAMKKKKNEGKLKEMNEPWFEITYKDSRGRKKTDSMRASSTKEAKKDFVNLMKGRGFKVLKVVKEGRTRLSPQKDLEVHSGGSIAQVFGKNAVVALDKKSMKELVKLIRMNMGLFEKLEQIMEGKSFKLSNGVKVEFLGKMQLKLTNYKGKKVILDVGELRMFLKGAKKDMGVRA